MTGSVGPLFGMQVIVVPRMKHPAMLINRVRDGLQVVAIPGGEPILIENEKARLILRESFAVALTPEPRDASRERKERERHE